MQYFHFIFCKLKNYIHVGGNKSPLFETPFSVPQGDPLSPILSNLYVLLAMSVYFPFNPGKKDITLAYINNYVLVTSGKSVQENIKTLEKQYEEFCAFSEGLGLLIEPNKRETPHF
ncbi:hypothetical protein AX15_004638 [Amanita polypyramis BW_CC]|nr:hypothetical protein AX15_004638 [Amanita polypyramis BW_CC]